MAIKLVALDVDGTLAEPREPVRKEIAGKLQNLEGRGVRIVLASGKNLWVAELSKFIQFDSHT